MRGCTHDVRWMWFGERSEVYVVQELEGYKNVYDTKTDVTGGNRVTGQFWIYERFKVESVCGTN